MKILRFAFSFAALALLASASPAYKVTLTQPAIIAGSLVKPGEYKIVVNGEKATLSAGKVRIEVPVKVENGNHKFDYTSIESREVSGKTLVEDIHVGGTTTTLVFAR